MAGDTAARMPLFSGKLEQDGYSGRVCHKATNSVEITPSVSGWRVATLVLACVACSTLAVAICGRLPVQLSRNPWDFSTGPEHAPLHEKTSQNFRRYDTEAVTKVIRQWEAVGAVNTAFGNMLPNMLPSFFTVSGSKVCDASESDDRSSITALPETSKTVRGPCYISQYNELVDAYAEALDNLQASKGDDWTPTKSVFEAHLNVDAANAFVDAAYVKVVSAKTDMDDFVAYLKHTQTMEACEFRQFGDTGNTSGAVLAAHPAIFRTSNEACDMAGASVLQYTVSTRGAEILEPCAKLPVTTTTTTTTTTSGSTATGKSTGKPTTAATAAPEPDAVVPRAQPSDEELAAAKASQAATCAQAANGPLCAEVAARFQSPFVTQETLQFQECTVIHLSYFKTMIDAGQTKAADLLAFTAAYNKGFYSCAHLAGGDTSWDALFSTPETGGEPCFRTGQYSTGLNCPIVDGSPLGKFYDYAMAASSGSDKEQIQIEPEWPFLRCVLQSMPVGSSKGLPGFQKDAIPTKSEVGQSMAILDGWQLHEPKDMREDGSFPAEALRIFTAFRTCHDPAVAAQHSSGSGATSSIFRRALLTLEMAFGGPDVVYM